LEFSRHHACWVISDFAVTDVTDVIGFAITGIAVTGFVVTRHSLKYCLIRCLIEYRLG
jgi:hypothetical protein